MPTFKEMLEAKKKEFELQHKKEEEAKLKHVEKLIEKPIKSPSLKPKKEIQIEAISPKGFVPTSDRIRIAYYCLTDRSIRRSNEEIKQQLRKILDELIASEQSKLTLITK